VSPPEQVTHRKTCDAPMCDEHATNVGPNLDHCPEHAKMSEHYPKSTIETTAYCKPCQRMTTHRVDGGRLGPCLEHETPIKPKPEKPKQKDLFE
jgi:hypothetical protein